jgi:hypothetical protein
MQQRFRKQSAASLRAAERREREDNAPRLTEVVPALRGLRLEIEERSGSSAVSNPKYTRRVVVATAPALFLIPCGDPSCNDGGHDVTASIMQALRSGRTEFDGEDGCSGATGSASCTRVMHYEAVADYAS